MGIDYPLRVGRNKYIKYKGFKDILYVLYSGVYFLITLFLTVIIGLTVGSVMPELLGEFLGLLAAIVAAGGFLALNISMVMKRSELTAVLYEANEKEFDIE